MQKVASRMSVRERRKLRETASNLVFPSYLGCFFTTKHKNALKRKQSKKAFGLCLKCFGFCCFHLRKKSNDFLTSKTIIQKSIFLKFLVISGSFSTKMRAFDASCRVSIPPTRAMKKDAKLVKKKKDIGFVVRAEEPKDSRELIVAAGIRTSEVRTLFAVV